MCPSGRCHRRRRAHPALIRSIFLLLGVGVLVPWNAFISAKDYFLKRLCGLDVGSHIETIFAVTFNLASVGSLGLILLLKWLRDATRRDVDRPSTSDTAENDGMDRQTATASRSQSFYMVTGSLALNLAVFAGQCCLAVWLAVRPRTFEYLVLLGVALCGVTGSILNAGIVATSAEFGRDVGMNAYFQGQAAGGLAVSAANFLAASLEDPSDFARTHCGDSHKNRTSMIFDFEETHISFASLTRTLSLKNVEDSCDYSKVDWAVLLYFFLGSATLIACILGYLYIYQLQRRGYETVPDEGDNDAVESLPRLGLELNDPHNLECDVRLQESPFDARSVTPKTTNQSLALTVNLDSRDGFDSQVLADMGTSGLPACTRNTISSGPSDTNMTSIYRIVEAPTWCIFLTFVVTLAMFPGWTSQLQSRLRCRSRLRLVNDLYTPLTFVVFNAGDLAGRILCGRFPMERVQNLSRKLVHGALLRGVLALLLLTCTSSSLEGVPGVPVISSDLYSLFLQALFALSNGFLVSLSFAHAPTLLPPSEHHGIALERMSEILSFALSFGLLIGSFCSYPISKLAS